ncbi:Uncharacterized conserved protein, DUF1800 family [Chryseolinea serpens]|uniref:Uncharacterized conserved protein, DUF1800 family n=1 Tax=Chryseolinea serpens TaxID=947013 RepID=A0A1M5L741_9BACT|nr:DUF1800 family protein [Chryseolinea serpens]SHG60821.1 Uncharacterized conserved protein, DUF1800 family [Chryseolinea serpens]
MPLPEFSGALGIKRAAHLLRRATFGATKQQIDVFAALTPAQAITSLFRQSLPDPALPIDPKTGQVWVLTPVTDANSMDLDSFLRKWIIGQMISAGVPSGISLAYSAREKMVHFLHTHFTTIMSKVSNSRSIYYQNQLFRTFALDALNSNPAINFKNLTVKISVDNAMLRVLDGNLNVKGSENENYARELLELYSIGRGLEGTLPPTTEQGDYGVYKEDDVKAAARVLSGWDVDEDFANLDPDTNLPRGKVKGSPTNASSHDNTTKQFSVHFGNATVQPNPALLNGGNPTEASALDEISQWIDLIYSSPQTAKNICWKIYRFFVYAPHTPEESIVIDGAIIAEMANTFAAGGFKLQPVIENLLRSQHFYEATAGTVTDDNFGGIIKSPIDLIIPTLRFFDITVPGITVSTTDFYAATGEIETQVTTQAMKFYEPSDIAGYESYFQFPIYHRWWITPNTLANRYNFIRTLITTMEQGMFKVNVYDFVKNNIPDAIAADARLLTMELAKYLLPVTDNLTFDDAADDTSGLTAKRLNYFKERFLQTFDEAYWTTRWNANEPDLRDQLEYLFNSMLQSPEYQLA